MRFKEPILKLDFMHNMECVCHSHGLSARRQQLIVGWVRLENISVWKHPENVILYLYILDRIITEIIPYLIIISINVCDSLAITK